MKEFFIAFVLGLAFLLFVCEVNDADVVSRNLSTDSDTLKVGPDSYKKHMLGKSDNVTWFMEQVEPNKVSKYFYKVTFKPSVITPDIEVR